MNRRLLLLAAIPAFALPSCNNNPIKGKPDYSKYRDSNVAVISGMVAPPHESTEYSYINHITQEEYDQLKDLGFNRVMSMYELDQNKDDDSHLQYILDSMKYAKNAGIDYIAKSATIYNGDDKTFTTGDFTNSKTMSKYKDNEVFKGHIITDEPPLHKFKLLAKTREFYKTEFPGKLFYVNLNPTYAPPEFIGYDYEEHINTYVEKVKPDVLSFDHYSLRVGDKGEGVFSIREDSLYCRETVAWAATNANIPYMNYVLITGSNGEKRDVSKEDVSWQVMTDLAYGCQGIQYFCIYLPHDNPGAGFFNSIIDDNGKVTKYGEYAKIMNEMMLNMDEAFLNYTWNGTMTIDGSKHAGETANPIYAQCKHSITSFDGIKSYEATNNTLIGCFKSKVDNYKGFMITNFEDPRTEIVDHVKIQFDNADALLTYGKEGTKTVDLTNSTYELDVAPGDGIFVIPYAK